MVPEVFHSPNRRTITLLSLDPNIENHHIIRFISRNATPVASPHDEFLFSSSTRRVMRKDGQLGKALGQGLQRG